VDFCCPANGLVVKVDGGIHRTQLDHDAVRTEELELLGYRVTRFNNDQILQDIDGIVAAIIKACSDLAK
jgi:very-short-patch-repair endonuclease